MKDVADVDTLHTVDGSVRYVRHEWVMIDVCISWMDSDHIILLSRYRMVENEGSRDVWFFDISI